MPVTVRSYAKINLGLGIGPAREDGFHALVTLYQTIDAHDVVTVDTRLIVGGGRAPRITVSSTDARVPADHRNTVWKMLSRAMVEPEWAGVGRDLHVHIEKRLPVQGGLGAGSANAAAALIAAEQVLGRRLSPERRLAIAAEVGSDVPLFLIGGTVLGLNRGEEVYPVPDLPPTICVVALPEVGVSTPLAFREWDAMEAARASEAFLTKASDSSTLRGLSRALAAALSEPYSSGVFQGPEQSGQEDLARDPVAALVRTGIRNDFEEVVFRLYPSLATIKRLLFFPSESPKDCASCDALFAGLSGSGSALFGLYRTETAAAAAEERLREAQVRSLRTRTLPRTEYWAKMARI